VLGCGKTLMVTDHVVTSKKGITRIHTTKAPIKNSSGNTIGIVGISRDITQSKEAEERLLESEANIKRAATNMKALLDNTEDAYVLVDKNFCIVTFNN
jgi:PAS domain-containing protein